MVYHHSHRDRRLNVDDLELSLMFISAVIEKDWETAKRLALEYEQGEQLSLFKEMDNNDELQ